MKIIAELPGQDFLEADSKDTTALRVVACSETLILLRHYKSLHGDDLAEWPLPSGQTHGELLLRELLLKQRQAWRPPEGDPEVCHCRAISRAEIDQSIVSGAHSLQQISRRTSACTACGTCRPEIEKLLEFRRKI